MKMAGKHWNNVLHLHYTLLKDTSVNVNCARRRTQHGQVHQSVVLGSITFIHYTLMIFIINEALQLLASCLCRKRLLCILLDAFCIWNYKKLECLLEPSVRALLSSINRDSDHLHSKALQRKPHLRQGSSEEILSTRSNIYSLQQ